MGTKSYTGCSNTATVGLIVDPVLRRCCCFRPISCQLVSWESNLWTASQVPYLLYHHITQHCSSVPKTPTFEKFSSHP